jgi:drug/metabolite transporter (DMT)-like permease
MAAPDPGILAPPAAAPAAAPAGAAAVQAKVVLLALANAGLMTAGIFFQKLNGARGGNVFVSRWLVLSVICYLPTFFLGNLAFAIGGKMSVFIPVSAVMYVLVIAVGRWAFGEPIALVQVGGCLLVLVGVALIASRG